MNVKDLGIDKKFQAMKEERDKKLALWEEISDFVAPNMGWFDNDYPNSANRRGEEIIDSTVRRALSTLQAGMQGGLTSPSKAWFQLTVHDPALAVIPAVLTWVGMVRDILINIFSQSNIYNRLHGAYGEIGAFGTAAILIEEDDLRVINARLFTAGEYAVSFDNAGLPNAFAREVWMSALDMRDSFGDKVSGKVQSALRNHQEGQWFKVYHIIAEDKGFGTPPKRITRFPYYSLYWEPDQESELQLGGYEEFPVLVPRWDTIGSDYYGYGPGEMALPESKTLQVMRAHFLRADELSIDPPVAFPQQVLGEQMQIRPGGVYFTSDPNNAARPIYQVQPNFEGHLQAIADSRDLIKQAFFADLFLMLAQMDMQGRMTATEVNIRQQEKMQMLGPVVERLEYELLNPLVGRTYMVAMRKGLIPNPPAEMAGQDIKVEYISMLAIAQKASSMDGINGLVALVTGLAGIDPEVVDKLNADEVIDQYARLSAIPAAVVNPEDQVMMVRASRQQQQAQEQQMQQAQQVATMAQQGGSGMRDVATAADTLGGLGGILSGGQPTGA